MQRLKFSLILIMVCFSNGAWAGMSEWFMSNCKKIDDNNGFYTRQTDIKKDSGFKNAVFYSGICAGKSVPSGQGHCVKIFSDSQTQTMAQAIQIAKDYAKEYNNDVISCHPAYFNCSDNDDHILCSTANNSAHYEFIFDDITETNDTKVKQGIALSYCKIVFGEGATIHDSATVYDKVDYTDCFASKSDVRDTHSFSSNAKKIDNMKEQCSKASNLLATFGYDTFGNSDYCRINFNTTYCYVNDPQIPGKKSAGLPTYKSIDNQVFKNIQIGLNQDVIMWLGTYVASEIKDEEITDFHCDMAAKTCKTDKSALDDPYDNYLTCYVNGHPIGFVFDDLSESWDTYKKGGQSGMQCISSDGIFDGRRCHGLNEEQCTALRTKSDINPNPIPTKWDKELLACTLTDANSAANIARIGEVAKTVGVATGIAVGTFITGGSTAMVLVASGAVLTTGGSEYIVDKERDLITKFTSKLLHCSNRKCVRDEFTWFLDTGVNYIDNLEDAQITAIDKVLEAKIPMMELDPEENYELIERINEAEDKNMFERCYDGDALQKAKCGFDTATIVLDFLPVSKMALKAPEAIGSFASKFGSKMPRTAKAIMKLKTSSSTLKKATKIVDKTDVTSDISDSMKQFRPIATSTKK